MNRYRFCHRFCIADIADIFLTLTSPLCRVDIATSTMLKQYRVYIIDFTDIFYVNIVDIVDFADISLKLTLSTSSTLHYTMLNWVYIADYSLRLTLLTLSTLSTLQHTMLNPYWLYIAYIACISLKLHRRQQ